MTEPTNFSTNIIGIDPGLAGGIVVIESNAAIDNSRRILAAEAMPLMRQVLKTTTKRKINPEALAEIIEGFTLSYPLPLAVLEDVGAMPGQGVVSMFTFGEGFGMIQGVLGALGVRVMKVKPSVWKSALGLNRDKQSSLDAAAFFWPSHSKLWTVKKNDGIAEAALLAEFGRRALVADQTAGRNKFTSLL